METQAILHIFQSQVRYFKDKGYASVRFDNKESACNAIVALHLTEVLQLIDSWKSPSDSQVENQVIKCSWGKEGGGARDDSQYGGGGGGYNSNQVRLRLLFMTS